MKILITTVALASITYVMPAIADLPGGQEKGRSLTAPQAAEMTMKVKEANRYYLTLTG